MVASSTNGGIYNSSSAGYSGININSKDDRELNGVRGCF